MGKEVYTKNRQTGKTNKVHDIWYAALGPGKRVSKSGNVYYEYRANRSDISKKRRM